MQCWAEMVWRKLASNMSDFKTTWTFLEIYKGMAEKCCFLVDRIDDFTKLLDWVYLNDILMPTIWVCLTILWGGA